MRSSPLYETRIRRSLLFRVGAALAEPEPLTDGPEPAGSGSWSRSRLRVGQIGDESQIGPPRLAMATSSSR